MDQKAEILMRHFRDGDSQRKISDDLSISRTTVRKYIGEAKAKFSELEQLGRDEEKHREKMLLLIEEIASKPKYDTSSRTKVKLTEDIVEEIKNMLLSNEKSRALGRHKQLMKNTDIHEKLLEKGYDIGYTTVCNYIRDNHNTKEAYVRQEYQLGETMEFDWGEVKLTIGGKMLTFQMGLMTTAKGSHHNAHLYHNQKMENFLDLHVKSFNEAAGVHREVVYDNMKQAVKKFVGRNEKEATDDLVKLSMYYGFKYRFCNVAKGNEKGHVERGIEFVRRKVFSAKSEFDTLEEANQYLKLQLRKLNGRKRNWLGNESPKDVLEKEKPYLLPLKPSYDSSRRTESRDNKYSVINIDQNKYSVPDYLVGKFVKVKIYPEEIKIYYKESKIAEHKRSFQNHKWIIDINHFIHTLKKKPGALHSSVGRHQLSPELQETYQRYYTNNPRDFIELLDLIKEKDTTTVLSAIKELKTIKKSLVTTDNIKNIVYKLPREELRIKREDVEIFESSTKQIQELNNLFNLESMGRYEN